MQRRNRTKSKKNSIASKSCTIHTQKPRCNKSLAVQRKHISYINPFLSLNHLNRFSLSLNNAISLSQLHRRQYLRPPLCALDSLLNLFVEVSDFIIRNFFFILKNIIVDSMLMNYDEGSLFFLRLNSIACYVIWL